MIVCIDTGEDRERFVEDAAAFVCDGNGGMRICRDGQPDEDLDRHGVVVVTVVP